MNEETITLSEAIKQGYTHFWLGDINKVQEDEFYCYPLTKEKLEYYIKRTTDYVFDQEEEDNSGGGDEYLFGLQAILCTKPYVISLEAEEIVNNICESNEDNDEMVPAVREAISDTLKEDEKFIAGLALINEALSTYRSFQDAGILVTID